MPNDTYTQLWNSPRMRRFFNPDGTFVSVRGGDGPEDTPTIDSILDRGEPETHEPETAPPTQEPAPSTAPEGSPPAGEPEGDTFPRSYVEELRSENKTRREEYQPYKDAFEGWGEDERNQFLDLAKQLLEAPESAAGRMIEIARNIYGDDFDNRISDTGPKFLTQEDIDRQFREREKAANEAATVERINKEARDLGYSEDTADWGNLFWYAVNKTGGDIQKAHAEVEAAKQAIVDKYLESKKAKNESFPAVTSGGTGTAQESEAPKTLDDARVRLDAMLAGQPGS